MSDLLDKITKALWSKNYPRTLIIFNINNLAVVLSGILVLILSYLYPVERELLYGRLVCLALIATPILGTVTAVLNQEIYEWIVFFTHGLIGFIIVPLYFCTMGTFYGVGLIMFFLTLVQSYVLVKNIPLKILTIALQNTLYVFLMIFAGMYPQNFINYPGELKVYMPVFAIAIVAMNVYIGFLARVFVYVFKMDYERTVYLTENVETVNAMDDLTGAYNKETGFDVLQNAMNSAWKNNESLSIAVLNVNIPQKEAEDNKYLKDLILVNTFDACRSVLSSSSPIVRLDENRFLLVLTECKTAYQIDPIVIDINSQFDILMQAAKVETCSLSFGYATLLHGMTLKQFVAAAEKNIEVRRAIR